MIWSANSTGRSRNREGDKDAPRKAQWNWHLRKSKTELGEEKRWNTHLQRSRNDSRLPRPRNDTPSPVNELLPSLLLYAPHNPLAKETQSSNSSPVCQLSLRACARVPTCSVASNSLWSMAFLSMGFSRQEYWSGLPFPIPGDLSFPGIELGSLVFPALVGRFFTIEPPGKPPLRAYTCLNKLSLYFLNHSDFISEFFHSEERTSNSLATGPHHYRPYPIMGFGLCSGGPEQQMKGFRQRWPNLISRRGASALCDIGIVSTLRSVTKNKGLKSPNGQMMDRIYSGSSWDIGFRWEDLVQITRETFHKDK